MADQDRIRSQIATIENLAKSGAQQQAVAKLLDALRALLPAPPKPVKVYAKTKEEAKEIVDRMLGRITLEKIIIQVFEDSGKNSNEEENWQKIQKYPLYIHARLMKNVRLDRNPFFVEDVKHATFTEIFRRLSAVFEELDNVDKQSYSTLEEITNLRDGFRALKSIVEKRTFKEYHTPVVDLIYGADNDPMEIESRLMAIKF